MIGKYLYLDEVINKLITGGPHPVVITIYFVSG
jgi:hypothetical protein